MTPSDSSPVSATRLLRPSETALRSAPEQNMLFEPVNTATESDSALNASKCALGAAAVGRSAACHAIAGDHNLTNDPRPRAGIPHELAPGRSGSGARDGCGRSRAGANCSSGVSSPTRTD